MRRATLDMSKKSNSKQKHDSPGIPSPKKRTSSVVGMMSPGAGAAKCVATAGEIFPNAAIDLVADPSDSYRLNLLLWDRSSATVAPRIEYSGSTYEAIALEASLVHAVQWPKCPIQ